MRHTLQVGIIALGVSLLSTLCLGWFTVSDQGTWPDAWPKELESYRKQAKTFGVRAGIQETVHEVYFSSREDFEKAWPAILKLKSKGHAPIELELTTTTSQVTGMFTPRQACVRILCPPRNTPNGSTLWEKEFPHDSPELPEYVHQRNNQWVISYDEDTTTCFRARARTDIVVVADGKIIDPKSATYPADAPRTPQLPKREVSKDLAAHYGQLNFAVFTMHAAYSGECDPKLRRGEENIPEKFWPDHIAELKPIRIYSHNFTDIVIVLHEENGEEEGLYLCSPYASTSPQKGKDGFTLL